MILPEVRRNISNYVKCLCPVCPVQEGSGCIDAKKEKWRELRKSIGKVLEDYPLHPEAYEMEMAELEHNIVGQKHGFSRPEKEDMIELYCSPVISKSNCGDLNDEKFCQCPTCAVWSAHLLRSTYYCLRGI